LDSRKRGPRHSRRIGPRFRRLSTRCRFECPVCGKPAPRYDRRELRTWRHLDTMQFKTYLIASLPRVECKEHGIQTVKVSWCEPGSDSLFCLKRFAITVLLAARVQAKAASLLRLSPSQIHDLMERSVSRGPSRRDRDEKLPHLSLDRRASNKATTISLY